MVEKDEVSKDFRKQILGYGLTTAEIVYRRPDRRWLLQTYVWQDYDMFPNFPALKDFLAFWEKSLEGRCSQSPSRIPSSSRPPNCTPSMACFGCTDANCSHSRRLVIDAYKLFASSLGVRPGREIYVRIAGVERDDEWIGPKRDVKPIQLLRGHARLAHRVQVVIDDLFASGDGLIRVGKNAMIGALAFIHIMSIVVN